MKLTIVTVNRNNATGLSRTLESTFASQSGFDDWEQIVVDGASTDGSFAALDKWKGNPHLGWHISEPDSGIYDAMNKGASHAHGNYLLFLNSGDELLPNVLADLFSRPHTEDILYGDVWLGQNGPDLLWKSDPPQDICPEYFLFLTFPHQSTFISRSLHERIGGYDPEMKVLGDRKFFFRCFLEGKPSLFQFSRPFSRMEPGGISSSPFAKSLWRKEYEAIIAPVYGRAVARRVAMPSEERPWMKEAVAEAARNDQSLAYCIRIISAMASKCWRFGPSRIAMRFMITIWRRLSLMKHTRTS